VAEWFKAHAWKATHTLPEVRHHLQFPSDTRAIRPIQRRDVQTMSGSNGHPNSHLEGAMLGAGTLLIRSGGIALLVLVAAATSLH
jgi:hypothetical protein